MYLKKVAFVGDAQAGVVADLYRNLIGARRGEVVLHYPWSGPIPSDFARSLGIFDLVCVQDVGSANAPLQKSGLAAGAVHHFPLLWSDAYWPFYNWCSPPEPRSGRGICRYRDRFLDTLAADGMSAKEAVDAYLALDFAEAACMGSPSEGMLNHYRAVEIATGISLAPLIEESFHDEQLFYAPMTPNPRLLAVMAATLLEQLGATREEVALARASRPRLPRQAEELPIHPRIAERLGLRYVNGQTCYRLGQELSFTFAEYVALYTEGLQANIVPASQEEDATPPLAALIMDLPTMPTSLTSGTQRPLTSIHDLLGGGKVDEASRQLALLCHDEPDFAEAHELLAETRWRSRELAGTAEAARRSLALAPQRGIAWRLLGHAADASGDASSAMVAAVEAVRFDPLSPDARNLLAEILESGSERGRAIEILRQGLALGVWNAQTFSLLGNFHLRDNELKKAEEALMLGLDIEPQRADMRRGLTDVRNMQAESAA